MTNRMFKTLALAALTTGLLGCDKGGAPSLDDVTDQVVAVGDELVVNLRGTDPDGDRLDYRFEAPVDGIESAATITRRPDGTGLFRWRPLAGDVGTYFFDFTVDDGSHTDTITVEIDVRPAVGEGTAPVFREPLGSGTTLDLERESCLAMDLVVDDTDDTEVVLRDEAPLGGAELVQVTGLTGTWNWCPSREQLASDDRFPITLSADDLSNPKTLKNYLLVVRQPPKPNCPGEAPVVNHTPEDATTILDVAIVTEISDDQGLKQAPILYYSTEAPGDPIDFSKLSLVEMDLAVGDMQRGTWTATVPNPVASAPAGTRSTLYYIISAGDNDDADGDCDHVTEAGTFKMEVENPGGSGGAAACEPCSADIQCGDAGDLCLVIGAGSACGSGCQNDTECPAEYSCVNSTSVEGAGAMQCVPDSGSCDPMMACDDDGFEDNDTLATAAPLSTGNHSATSCPTPTGNDDEDWYRLDITADNQVTANLSGSGTTDLDLVLYTAQGGIIEASDSLGDTESVTSCLEPGTYYLRVLSYQLLENDYSLSYTAQAMSCSSTCTDDGSENDDNQAQARTTDIFPNDFVSTTNAICSMDDDWFEVELFTNETVVVDLTFTHGDGDLDLHFIDQSGTDLTPCSEASPNSCTASQGQSTTDDEHYEFTVTQSCAPCSYYVMVHGWDGAENLYDIRIGLQ